MALPKLITPTFELMIPSTGQKVMYRPFLVKEEKILLMALEGKDPLEMANALQQIVTNCCQEDLDLDKLAPFDLEYFFIHLRAKSVGETIELTSLCDAISKGKTKKECGHNIEFVVDIDKIEVVHTEGHTDTIALTDDIGIVMKYPPLKLMIGQDDEQKNTADMILDTIAACVVSIYDATEVYKAKDTPREELLEFLDGLNRPQFDDIQKFFTTMPKVQYKAELKCPKCKNKSDVVVEGMQNFFG